MWDIAIVTGAFALLCAPGVLLWRALFPDHDSVDSATWGASLSLALAVLTAFYAAQFRISYFWPAWLVISVLLIVVWLFLRRRAPVSLPNAGWLALVLVVVAVTRFAPTLVRDVPPGWDPSFHLLLAKKLLLTDHIIQDWLPFENVKLNYPLGSHLLVVVVTRLTAVPLHRVFQLLFPLLGVLATAQVYCLARKSFSSDIVGLYASIAYGLWAFGGSIGYYLWGGLPNAVGMIFLLPVFALLLGQRWTWIATAVMAVLCAAVCLTHHQVLLTAAGTIVIALLYRGFVLRESVSGPLLAGFLAALLAFPQLRSEFLILLEINRTGALHDVTDPMTTSFLLVNIGIAVATVGIAGGVLYLRSRDRRREPGLLLAIAVTLVFAYVLCGPVYGLYSRARWGEAYVAFAASRFLADFAYFVSIFAGYAVYRVADRTGMRVRAAVVLMLAIALSNLTLWRGLYAPGADPGQWRAYSWIQDHTAASSVLLSSDPWTTYAAWRRATYTPVPPSEPKPAQSSSPDVIAARNGHPVSDVYVVVAPRGESSTGEVMWRDPSGWRVIQVQPRHPAPHSDH